MTMTQQLGQEPVDVDTPADEDTVLWSVTTILGTLDKPALLYWAAEQTAVAAIVQQSTWRGMVADCPDGCAHDTARDCQAVKWLRDARYRRPKTRLSAADLGSTVHALCEEYALTGQRPDADRITHEITQRGGPNVDVAREAPTATAMLEQFDRWLERFTPTYHATEVAVYSPTYGYAGTADAFLAVDGYRAIVDYKGLPLTTPLPTPTGWTTMETVRVGERVIGTNGQAVTVTAKSDIHERDCYRITFDDATSIVCDDQHLWSLYSTTDATAMTLRTDEIPPEIRHPTTGRRHLAIRLPEPLDLPMAALPVDPYVYGCWLGDGSRDSGTVTKPDDELFSLIARRGYTIGQPYGRGGISRTVYGLRHQLRTVDLLGHRDVPQVYLRASVQQRLALLRGLMDTDGSWNATRKQAVFMTVDKSLAETVYELAISLGERAHIASVAAHGFGHDVTAYPVSWRPQRFNPFAMSRKANPVIVGGSSRSSRRLIQSVERTITVPSQCVTVDAADGCYLAGRQMVATHNTSREPRDSRGALKTPYPEVAPQLAAYRFAEYAAVWRPRRTEKFRRRYYLLSASERALAEPVPEVDGGLCLHITPESCEAFPVRCDEDVHQQFLFIQEVARWSLETSKAVIGQPIVPNGRN